MANTVHNWIVDAVGLSEQRSPDCEQWSDVATFKDSSVVDDTVWCPKHNIIFEMLKTKIEALCLRRRYLPGHEPQRNGHKSNFGQFTFSAGILCFC